MKSILAWTTYILNLLVAFPVIFLLFLFGAASWGSPILSGFCCMTLFGLWGYYQYHVLVLKDPIPKEKRRGLRVAAISIVAAIIPLALALRGCGLHPSYRDQCIHAADYRQALSKLKKPSPILQRMIPTEATDIELFYAPGFAPMVHLKCSLSEEALRAFGAAHGYDFQGENMFRNSDADNPGNINGFSMALQFFHAEEANDLHNLKNFLAYSCIHRNGGGLAFLYIVDKQLLYGHYAHH